LGILILCLARLSGHGQAILFLSLWGLICGSASDEPS
jgi:hypothetical protein